ncbi:MAG: hypothetical protein K9J82_09610 [Methylotenera sp.]|jgi:hypothetical protein|nr:hypothetical protein [Methylotenera sp.]
MTKYVGAFTADQRRQLDQLERFAQTPEYERLLGVTKDFNVDADVWLAKWLVRPAFGLDAAPRGGHPERTMLSAWCR